MADSYFNFEARLRQLGVIEKGDFTTAAGMPANKKINLEHVIEQDFQLVAEIADILAIRLALHKPDLLIPVPDGANAWAEEVAAHMKKEVIQLRWLDKGAGILRFAGVTDIRTVREAERIAIIDDVYTTGSSINKVIAHRDISSRSVAAGVIWNRSNHNPRLDVPVETVIDSYVPLHEENGRTT